MSSSPLYSIVVSGERFNFTRDQLESDPGNHFATYFFGGFTEAAQGVRELVIEKEPMLFKLIQAHLRGYNALPIPDSFIPAYMTKERALDNLLLEAQFYGLSRLCATIQEFQSFHSNTASSSAKSKYKLVKISPADTRTIRTVDNLEQCAFQTLLQRVATCPGLLIKSVDQDKLEVNGYTMIISWAERRDNGDQIKPSFVHYALVQLKNSCVS